MAEGDSYRARYVAECPRCHEPLEAHVEAERGLIPPPYLQTCHSCSLPVQSVKLEYVG